MQIIMFAVNSADFVYLFFVLLFDWLFEIQFVCRFALFVGVWLASVAAASFWCYVVLFCISTFIFIYLCCVRRVVSEKWSSLVFVLLCLVCRRLLLLLLLSSVSIDKSYRIANCRRRCCLCCLDSRIMSQIDRGSCDCDYFHIANKS